MLRSASRCALFGAAGALMLSASDFGASCLWLPEASDRVELLARLLAIEIPLGAVLGALLGAFGATVAAPTRRFAKELGATRWEPRLWPLPFVLLSSPGLLAVAWLLFTGGSASRLALRPLFVAAAALVLVALAYTALRTGRAIVRAAPRMTRAHAALSVSTLVLLGVAATQIDRIVLPGLYEYLHAALTLSAWLLGALAAAVLLVRSPRARSFDRRGPAIFAPSIAALLAFLVAGVWTLDRNPGMRVVLLSPRAPSARSLMLAAVPVLSLAEGSASAEEIDRARRARARRRARRAGGPVLDDAHVLLVTIDALRADHLGTYGYRARPTSSELDRFASESVVFETAYAQVPHSSHSISSLMTGDYVYQRSELALDLPRETIASTLREIGYYTAAFYTEGIFHTDGEHLARYRNSAFGFSRRAHALVDAEPLTDAVLAEVSAVVEAGEPPSLIWAHFFDVHEPYDDTSFGTGDEERYDGEIRVVDRAFARLLRDTRARFTRPLVVVVTADHGEEFREHGGVYHGTSVYQEQIRVPLIVHVPGLAPRRVRAPVETVDIAPTLLGLLGVPPPSSMRGDDLRPLAAGAEADLGPAFASAGTRHMVVSWPHKLVLDLRLGTVELYDLGADASERQNLAGAHAQRVETLRGELHAWLDSLASEALDPSNLALHRGRLRDRSAAPGLAALVEDEAASAPTRVEAARLLATIPHGNAVASLRRAALSPEAEVAAEAAITLAWLGASGPREPLHALLSDRDRARRVRAAIGLGRLRDPLAVPVLVGAIGAHQIDAQHRTEAIRLLGLLRDPRAVDGLLALLDDAHMRRRAVLALGRIGDARALRPLLELLAETRHSMLRDTCARALGQLGDRRAVPQLVALAAAEPLPSAAESLVRLGAVGTAVGGIDLAPGVEAEGLGQCHALAPAMQDEPYLDRTTCETSARRVTLALNVPASLTQTSSVVLLLRARTLEGDARVRVRLAGDVRTITLTATHTEHRIALSPSAFMSELVLELPDDHTRLVLDHVLLLPSR